MEEKKSIFEDRKKILIIRLVVSLSTFLIFAILPLVTSVPYAENSLQKGVDLCMTHSDMLIIHCW